MKRRLKRDRASRGTSRRRELQKILGQARAYFDRVDSRTHDESSPEDQRLVDELSRRILQAVTEISNAASSAPMVGTLGQNSLRIAMKRMVAALNLYEYQHWPSHVIYDEDVFRKGVDAGDREDPISSSSARQVFEKSYKEVVGVLDVLEVAQRGTRPSSDFTHTPDHRTVVPQAKRERNPWVSARRTELRNMMRQGQETSALEVCKRWDLEGIRVPSGWAMDKLTATWVGAYNNRKLRGRVQKLISTEMRNIRRPA